MAPISLSGDDFTESVSLEYAAGVFCGCDIREAISAHKEILRVLKIERDYENRLVLRHNESYALRAILLAKEGSVAELNKKAEYLAERRPFCADPIMVKTIDQKLRAIEKEKAFLAKELVAA